MILKDMNYTGPVKIPSVSLPSLEQTTDAAENLQAEREQKKKKARRGGSSRCYRLRSPHQGVRHSGARLPFWGLSQEDCIEFEARLGYTVNIRITQ
jgi:hypothetical protein